MDPHHLYALAVPADPILSPDATLVAFTVSRPREATNDYQTTLAILRLDGKSVEPQVTAGGARESAAAWSPDSRTIAFLSDAGCVARGQSRLWITGVNVASGGATIDDTRQASAITPPLEFIRDVAWSPDGKRIAFTATGSDEDSVSADGVRRITRLGYRSELEGWSAGHSRQVYVVEADGAHVLTQLSQAPYRHNGIAWDPTGASLITASARHPDWDIDKITDLYMYDLESQRWSQLTEGMGQCVNPTWQPSGAYVAFYFNASAYYGPTNWQLAVAEPARGLARIRTLTDAEMLQCRPTPEHQRPEWMDDGRILFAVEQRGESKLLAISPSSTTSPSPVLDVDGTITGFDQKNGRLVLIRSASDRPPELWHGSRQLTQLSREFVAATLPQRAHRFSVAGVDAWVMPPAGTSQADGQVPILVSLHGGPFFQYANAFLEDFQAYSAAGFAVIYANPRGSSGYGEQWGRAISAAGEGGSGFGGADAADVLSVIDAALESFPYCDPRRVGLIGGSYGGTLALHILSRTDRFAAACVERGVSDFQSFLGTSDLGIDFTTYCGSVEGDGWRMNSPLTVADHITTPLLIIHSEDDVRVPIGQADQLFTALRLRHRPVEMLRFPAGGHELSRKGPPRLRVARLEAIISWFHRWLSDAAP